MTDLRSAGIWVAGGRRIKKSGLIDRVPLETKESSAGIDGWLNSIDIVIIDGFEERKTCGIGACAYQACIRSLWVLDDKRQFTDTHCGRGSGTRRIRYNR